MPSYFRLIGDETLANTTTGSAQQQGRIAARPGGGFVIVWQDLSSAPGDPGNIRMQLFDASGAREGSEVIVTVTAGVQINARVAALANGNIAVSWADASLTGGDASGNSVKARFFSSAGAALNTEFLVNTNTANSQTVPTPIGLTNGSAVILWQDFSQTLGDSSPSIKGQLLSANGAKIGSEFLVNTVTAGGQFRPTGVALDDGGFAAVWRTNASATDLTLSYQHFDATGGKVGAEVRLNVDLGTSSAIAKLADGSVVVVWDQLVGPSQNGQVYYQHLTAAGALLGAPVQVVDPSTTNQGGNLTVVALSDGGFQIGWSSIAPLSGDGDVRVQAFAADGTLQGTVFTPHSANPRYQGLGSAATLENGDVVYVWVDTSGRLDPSSSGVHFQRVSTGQSAISDIGLSDFTLSPNPTNGREIGTLSSDGTLNTVHTYTIIGDSTGGGFATNGTSLIVADGSKIGSGPQAVVVRADDGLGHTFAEILTVAVAQPIVPTLTSGNEMLVNTSGLGSQHDPVSISLGAHGFIVLWTGASSPQSNGATVRGQLFDMAGNKIGGELVIDPHFQGDQSSISGAMTSSGLVVTWIDSILGIRAQRLDFSGSLVGSELAIATQSGGDYVNTSTVALQDGGFAVGFTRHFIGGGGAGPNTNFFESYYNTFRADGTPRDNTIASLLDSVEQNADDIELIGLKDGSFLISYVNFGGARVLWLADANGVTQAQQLSGFAMQADLHAAGLASGGFVVVGAESFSSGGFSGERNLSFQLFDAYGHPLGGPIVVDADAPAQFDSVAIAATSDGGFVVTWNRANGSTVTNQIVAQHFDAFGSPLGIPFQVSQGADANRYESNAIGLADDGFVIAWTDADGPNGDGSGSAIKARVFHPTVPHFAGSAGADTLAGTSGSDVLDATLGGLDTLNGMPGNDRLIVGAGNSASLIDGGSGTDTLVVTGGVALGSLVSIEAIEFQFGSTLTLTGAQFIGGLTSNATLSGTGSLVVNMGAGDSELYLQQLITVGGANVAITVNGTTGDDAIKGALGSVNTINGGEGSDFIRGGQRADTINGGNGNDKIEGGQGADILTGGAGADVFRYQSANASGVGAAADRITDFVSGTDKLGFLRLDSDPVAPGQQGFSYIDTQAFHGTGAAEVRYGASGADLLVQLDLNGDAVADMEITLQGLGGQSLSSGDFLLNPPAGAQAILVNLQQSNALDLFSLPPAAISGSVYADTFSYARFDPGSGRFVDMPIGSDGVDFAIRYRHFENHVLTGSEFML